MGFTDFDAIKQNGYTNILKYRGEQRSGISYDYMEKLNEFTEAGIFIDANGDGFTNAEKQALEDELFKIHREHNYSTNFKSMREGTKTEYSYEDFIRLAQAAGYILKEEYSKPLEAEPETVKEETADVKNEVLAANIDKPQTNSAEYKLRAELDADAELAGKDIAERINILNNRQYNLYSEKSELQDNTVKYQTKGFLGLFKKTKERNLTEQEIAQRQKRISEIDIEADRNARLLAFAKYIDGKKYWVDKVSAQTLKDENGNTIKEYPTYIKVTLTGPDGSTRRAVRIDNYDPQTLKYNYKYYALDIQKVGDPNVGDGLRYSLVPDLETELNGYTDPTVQ